MADNSFKNFLGSIYLKLKSFLSTKDVLSFLLFFVIASIFWFVNALDKNRDITIEVPIQIILPKEIAIENKVPEFISVEIRDLGVHLFSYSDKKIKPLNLSFPDIKYKNKGKIQLDAATLNKHLQNYLLPSTKILNFKPGSIEIDYQKLTTKIVPVKVDEHITTDHQYMLAGNILIQPGKIKIYGPASVIDTIHFVITEAVYLKNLNDTTVVNAKVKPMPFVKTETEKIKVTFPVVMFTEKTVDLEVEAVNFPEFINIWSFPAYVKANINIAINKFNDFKSSDIQVYIDYNDLSTLKSPKYRLKVKNNNPNINNIRLSPSEVEFILEHN